jgi:hypothetical protein
MGLAVTNFFVMFSARDQSSIYYDLGRAGVFGTIGLVADSCNLVIIFVVGCIS